MNLKQKSDETSSNPRSNNSWRNYYDVPKQMLNQVRNYIPSSIADYWSGNFGIGSNTIGTCYFQPPKKSKGTMEKSAQDSSQPYVVDANNYSMYNQYVYDVTTRSQQPVNVVQNKGNVIFDASIPPPFPSKQPSYRPPPPSSYPDKACTKTQPEACSSPVGPSKSSGPRVIGFGGCSKAFVPKTPGGYFIKGTEATAYNNSWWGYTQQQQFNHPFPHQQWQIVGEQMVLNPALVADTMLDTATDILLEYICQETDPNSSDLSSTKSNLNPDAKEFIPKHLMAHFVNNQNSEYLNKAMLETAIKSSIADVARNKSDLVNKDNISSDIIHDDSDKNKEILNNANVIANEISSQCFNEKLTACDKLLVKNENVNAINDFSNESLEKLNNETTHNLSFQNERDSENKLDSLGAYKDCSNENIDQSLTEEISSSSSNENIGKQNCDNKNFLEKGHTNVQSMMQETSSNSRENSPKYVSSGNNKPTPSSSNCVTNFSNKSDNCQSSNSEMKIVQSSGSRDYFTVFEDDIPVKQGDFRTKKVDFHKKENDGLQGKSCPVKKEPSFEDFLDSKCYLLSSSSGSESSDSSFSDNCKSLSRNLSESSEDSLVQFNHQSPDTSVGVPKFVRLDSTEVAQPVSEDESTDGEQSEGEDDDSDWDEVDDEDQVDWAGAGLLDFFPSSLCISNLRPTTTQCIAVQCLPMTVQMPACLLPVPGAFKTQPSGIARINSIRVVGSSPPQCHQISSSSCDNGFGAENNFGGIYDFGAKNVDESTLDIVNVNKKWSAVPEINRKSEAVVKFSCNPVTVHLEPEHLAEDLKQARISDFASRQADKERRERLLAPILTKEHRDKVYQRLQATSKSCLSDVSTS